ncbi:MAG: hypothetical protein JSV84_02535 [Gemmatimonadota bacterium]|nr:MAG: hypothetical protein JSV84_02535 [Gemmatimonadota bacterium]
MKNLIFTAAVLFLTVSLSIEAQIPRTLSYQGVLCDASGNPKPDSNYTITFALYDVSNGETAMWNETKSLNLRRGLFNTVLGDQVPFGTSLKFDRPYWLGIQVQGEPELIPRIPLTSVAYSLNSLKADSAKDVSRPIDPPIAGNEIADDTVVRRVGIVDYNNLIDTVLTDTVFVAAGENIQFSLSQDTVTIAATGGDGGTGNTLDQAYDQGGAGAGRTITADAGAVEINGDDGLKVTGTKNVIEATTSSFISTGIFQNTSSAPVGGNALFAEITDANNPKHAIEAKSAGTGASILAWNTGDGNAGWFQQSGTDSKAPALYSVTFGSGNTFEAKNYGSGKAGKFIIENALNDSAALYAETDGIFGKAGEFKINNSSSDSPALYAETNGPGHGIYGLSGQQTNLRPETAGVAGESKEERGVSGCSENSDGVYGLSGQQANIRPETAGVVGESKDRHGVSGYSENSDGVYGVSGQESPQGDPPTAGVTGNSNGGNGVSGISKCSDGVFGTTFKCSTFSRGPTAIRAGVHGVTSYPFSEPDHFAVAGVGTGYATGVLGIGSSEGSGVLGVSGTTNIETNAGIRGFAREHEDGSNTWPPYFRLHEGAPYGKGKTGVLGQAVKRVGVWGESIEKFGVVGNAGKQAGFGHLPNATAGVLGMGFEANGVGVYGKSEMSFAGEFKITESTNDSPALYVETQGTGRAANLQINNSNSDEVVLFLYTIGQGEAAYIVNDNPDNFCPALFAYTNGIGGAAHFTIDNSDNYWDALYATTSGYGNAAYLNGDVTITGSLDVHGCVTKGCGSFKIDHPLDPENKYLVHSFVESPDMKNVYDGVVVLDGKGDATVELPEWFEVLNNDFRYQLTPIGAPGPNLYIAEEISNNRFRISGGSAGMKVSWQITGIRKDPYSMANRIQVEKEKEEKERGYYLHPEVYGQPEEKGIKYLHAKNLPDREKTKSLKPYTNESIEH